MKEIDRILGDLREAARAEFEDRKKLEIRVAKAANPETVEACRLAFDSDEVALRRTAVEVLKRIGKSAPGASEALVRQLPKEPDVKTRRRIAAALGDLADPDLIEPLSDALAAEEHRFAQASIILALGKLGCREFPPPFDVWDQDFGPVFEALKKAGAQTIERSTEPIARKPGDYLLSSYPGLESALACELRARDLPAGVEIEAGFRELTVSRAEDLRNLGNLRSALLDFRIATRSNDEAAALRDGVDRIREEIGQTTFRLMLPGAENKNQYVKNVREAAELIEKRTGWRNAPAAYALDLRVLKIGGEFLTVWRLGQWPEPAGRDRKPIPASIHPSVAASLCAIAAPGQLLKKSGLTICDPACGAGTILMEAGALFPDSKLIGSDWSAEAIELAKSNLDSAGLSADLSRRDFRQLNLPAKSVDFVISNLPFGIRVRIQNIEGLYAKFLSAARRVLKPDGVAVIYTANQKAIHAAFKSGAKPKPITRVEASGLSVFVFRISARELRCLR